MQRLKIRQKKMINKTPEDNPMELKENPMKIKEEISKPI